MPEIRGSTSTTITFGQQSSGSSVQSAETSAALPLYSYAQIGDQLVNDFWAGDWHAFNVTAGVITVNVTALAAAGQSLARAALDAWPTLPA
ncbi:MAG: hypothetical protein M3438_09635 [Pseudomonadota bacterium]|nr:hypothetical protein [Sphingomonas sp.]MDQ3479402.1 hypothetical protein [Pseudomonadota bacterium]